MLQLRAVSGPTAKLLEKMLKEKGLLGGHIKGIVNYGYNGDHDGLPTLNAHAGAQNKYLELVKLDAAGVITIPFSENASDLDVPIFGRKLHHTRGTDIQVYRVKPLKGAKKVSDYYTQLIPKASEYRIWVYRDKVLATYEKVLTYANKLGLRGRNKEVWNWANGYAYNFVAPELAPVKGKQLALDAVKALGLDFGAVDLLRGKDGHFYALEVNTAPGTQGQPRQGISSLVNCIEKWAKNGFPKRAQ